MPDLSVELPARIGFKVPLVFKTSADLDSANDPQIIAWAAENAFTLGYPLRISEEGAVYQAHSYSLEFVNGQAALRGREWNPLESTEDAEKLTKFLSGLYPAKFVPILEAIAVLKSSDIEMEESLREARRTLTRCVAAGKLE